MKRRFMKFMILLIILVIGITVFFMNYMEKYNYDNSDARGNLIVAVNELEQLTNKTINKYEGKLLQEDQPQENEPEEEQSDENQAKDSKTNGSLSNETKSEDSDDFIQLNNKYKDFIQ